MTFPHFHSDFERQSLKRAAELAIETHGQPEHLLNEEASKLRRREHTGIELSGPELVYLQHDMSEKISALRTEIYTLERSIGEGTAPNSRNAEENLQKLKQKLNFLQHNFAEKLFKKTEDTDNEVSI
ncbi:MAG: hypothetical protein NUV88_01200 [Candidatus Kaiserbacteria bacterium]|nr:hypothetical protein [Candidatus Kaiserbacteria bacterium]